MSRRQSSQVANPSGGGSSISERSRPEAGERLGVGAVDDKLESSRHRAPFAYSVVQMFGRCQRMSLLIVQIVGSRRRGMPPRTLA